MSVILEDGTGSGKKLKINNDNRALTDAVVHFSDQNAAGDGRLFQFGTSTVTLTSANESAVLYVKNNEDFDLEIVNFTYGISGQTGANPTDMILARLYKNPTTITSGTPTIAINNNLGSSKELEADLLVGVEGSLVTGGTQAGNALLKPFDFRRIPLYWVVPKGTSLAITFQPATGNTNVSVDIFFDAYLSSGD